MFKETDKLYLTLYNGSGRFILRYDVFFPILLNQEGVTGG